MNRFWCLFLINLYVLLFAKCALLSTTEESNYEEYNLITDFHERLINVLNGSSILNFSSYSNISLLNVKEVSEWYWLARESYLVQAELSNDCYENNLVDCKLDRQQCEVLFIFNSPLDPPEIVYDESRCADIDSDNFSVSSAGGFSDRIVDDGIQRISEAAVRNIDDSSSVRTIVDIMSVKELKQTDELNTTKLFITLKAAVSDEGLSDVSKFEVCEIEVVMSSEDMFSPEGKCFPVSDTDTQSLEDDNDVITEQAKNVVSRLNEISSSHFIYALDKILNAEKSVTPGSCGTLLTFDVRLVPTICVKKNEYLVSFVNITEWRNCTESKVFSKIKCTISTWTRPWSFDAQNKMEDVVYSQPSCLEQEEEEEQKEEPVDPTSTYVYDATTVSGTEEPVPIPEHLESVEEEPVMMEVIEEPIIREHISCTGCPIDLDLNVPGLEKFVDEALEKIDADSNSENMHKLLKLVRAQKQVVNGVKYIITVDVSKTSCLKNSNQARDACEQIDGSPTKTCIVEFLEKPWIQSHEILYNSCSEEENSFMNEIIPVSSSDDANRDKLLYYLDNMDFPHSMDIHNKDNSVTSDSDEQQQLNGGNEQTHDESKVSEEEKIVEEPFVRQTRQRRDTSKNKFGEPKDFDESEKDFVHELAELTVQTLDSLDVEGRKRAVLRIIDSKKQVQDGMLYTLTLRIAVSPCSDNHSGRNDCTKDQPQLKICKVQLHRHLGGDTKVIQSECKDESASRKSRRSLLGAPSTISVDDPNVKRIADFALSELDQTTNSPNSQFLVKITEASRQVVSGTKYYLVLEVTESTCRKGADNSQLQCARKEDSSIQTCHVEVWEQPWLHKIQLQNSSCGPAESNEASRRKRGIPGGVSTADVNDQHVQEAAQHAVSHIEQTTNSENKLVLVSVKEAKTQVVAGTNYILKIEIGESDCRKGSSGGCQLKTDSQNQICDVTVWSQPWLNSNQVTSLSCSPAESSNEANRRKREILGGESAANVDDQHVQEAAQHAVSHIEQTTNSENKLVLVTVKEAKTQVVAGTNYILKIEIGESDCRKGSTGDCQLKTDSQNQICDVTVWSQPWLNSNQVTSLSCSPAESSNEANRRKRGIPGGVSTADVDDQHVQEAAQHAVSHIEQTTNSENKLVLVSVKEAKTQVVAGTNYIMKIEIGESDCRKGSSGGCQLKTDSQNQICDVTVWSQPWLNSNQVTSLSCSPAESSNEANRRKRGIPGGASTADVNDQHVQEAAQHAVSHIEQTTNSENKLVLVSVKEAKTQVVAGTNYILKIEIGESDCRKGSSGGCQLKTDSQNQICDVTVWSQPWLNSNQVTSLSCSPAESSNEANRRKREILGGESAANVDDQHVQEAAQHAVSHIEQTTNSENKLVLVTVKEAKTQVVAGTNYILKIEIGESDCRKGSTGDCQLKTDSQNQICDVTVWSQPWLNSNQVTSLSCSPAESSNEANRRKRGIPGGVSTADVDDQHVQEAAQHAVSHIEQTTNSENKLVLVSVKEAKTQVVAGTNYILKIEIGESDCRKGSSGGCQLKTDSQNQICDVTVWSQPWLNSNQVTSLSCSPAESSNEANRRKRGIPGGASTADVNDQHVQEAAQHAVSHIEQTTNSENKLVLVSVKEAKTQVVAGTNYILKIEIGESDCRKGSSGGCQLKTDSQNQICDVTVWSQPWLNSNQVTSLSCSPAESSNEANRRKREILGGESAANVDDQHVQEAAQHAVSHIEQTTNSENKLVLVTVKEAKTQVVAGTNYILKIEIGESDCRKGSTGDCQLKTDSQNQICDVTVWSQPWLNSNQVTSLSCSPAESSNEANRRKRGIPGGVSTADVDDQHVQEAAQHAVSHIEQTTNSENKLVLVSVKEAKTQVVAGTNYILKIEIGESDCRKGSSGGCQLKTDSQNQICDVTVWSQPWLNSNQVTSLSCSPAESSNEANRRKRGIPGGASAADVDDQHVQEAAQHAVSHIEQTTNSENKLMLVSVKEAKTQIVSGTKYILKIEVGESDCQKESSSDVDCHLKTDSQNKLCDVTVWSRPWLKDTHVTSLSCNPVDLASETPTNRRRRHTLLGAPKDIDVNDPYIEELSNFAVAELDKSSNSLFAMKKVKVIKASSQVVSGTLVHLTVEVGRTSCRKKKNILIDDCEIKDDSVSQICTFTIWDQPWKKHREVSESSCGGFSPKQPQELATNRRRRNLALPRKMVKDPYLDGLSNFATAEFDKSSNSLYAMKKIKILNVTLQAVTGTVIQLTLKIGPTSCRKSKDIVIDDCKLLENGDEQICKFEIWDPPSKHRRELLRSRCGNNITFEEEGKRMALPYSELENDEHQLAINFQNFISKYNKHYTDEEFEHRFRMFKGNIRRITQFQEQERGTAYYGVNQFADLSPEEFRQMYLGYKPNLASAKVPQMQEAAIPDVKLPKEFDWRHYNVVTEVKNQGMCGSCWAFSTTGNVESLWAIRRGKLYSLSEQELVDCDKLDDGCKGGLMTNAYKAIQDLGGLETESEYPYEGDDEKCHFNKSEVRVTITGGLNITKNETKMAQWLFKNGPISVALNANAMQFYLGGVSHPWKFMCDPDPDSLDHGVLIVGFGVDTSAFRHKLLPYWIIKNSWGEDWGESGYYRLYRGDGSCGINQMASSAII